MAALGPHKEDLAVFHSLLKHPGQGHGGVDVPRPCRPQVNKIFIRFLAFPPQMGYVTGFCRLMLRISPISAI